MLSFIVPARSQPTETRDCLASLLNAVRVLGIEPRCEFIFLDDDSEPQHGLLTLFKEFRKVTTQPVTIGRFKQRQHYTGVYAYGQSKAKGDGVFMISNDMVLTPQWLRTILAVAAMDPSYGIVRGTADLVDSHPEHSYPVAFDLRGPADIEAYAHCMETRFGLSHTIDDMLSGDAVLIKRELIQRIGVFDRRFYGYFSDVDYGIRAQRCGFKLVCAKGAWLRHYGAGHIRADVEAKKVTQDEARTKRMELVQAAFVHFRQKWDMSLPEKYAIDLPMDMERCRKAHKGKGFEHTPPIKDDPGLIDLM
jgi:hypothetical protein